MDIEYSVLNEDGLDRIASLWEKLRDHHALKSTDFSASMKSKTFEQRKKELLEKAGTGKLRIYLATDGIAKKDVGYCIASLTSDGEGEIDSIFIEEEYRHREIGEYLLSGALGWLESFSSGRIVLQVIAGNEEVFEFYERFGFKPRSYILEQKKEASE